MSADAAGNACAEPSIVVDIPPPSRAVRDGVARLVVEFLARRALADLGIVAENDNANKHRGSHG